MSAVAKAAVKEWKKVHKMDNEKDKLLVGEWADATVLRTDAEKADELADQMVYAKDQQLAETKVA